MKRKLLIIVVIVLLLCCCPQTAYAVETDLPFERFGEFLFPETNKSINEKVYLSGKPVGITIDGDGVTVIGINEFVSTDGVVSPAEKCGLAIGDKIVKIDSVAVTSVAQLAEQADLTQGKTVEIQFLRNGELLRANITTKLCALTKKYKIGVYVRDNASGIGTLTYIRKNLQFGCLGHPIITGEKGEIVKIKSGKIYDCSISGVEKGVKGEAGELRGVFDVNKPIGTLYINNRFGVYGNVNQLPQEYQDGLYSVATSSQIKPGNAEILTTVDGNTPCFYDIEILRVIAQTSASDKGLVLRITDPELLEITGGIVQGMSGSPIIQDGRFAGAITHVFVNDPTRGYGILAEWMLEN